jgi:hypothetical protein
MALSVARERTKDRAQSGHIPLEMIAEVMGVAIQMYDLPRHRGAVYQRGDPLYA